MADKQEVTDLTPIESRYIRLIIIFFFITLIAQAQNKETCRVALVQAHLAWGNVEANLDAFQKRVDHCNGCDLIVFPELFVSGCEMKKKDKEVAMKTKDEIAAYYPIVVDRMKQWAANANALVIGSTIYKDEGKYYNRLLAVFPDGHYTYYDKHNCFKKGSFSPGDKHLILNWKGRRFATYICYDLRFPEWSHNDDRYDTAIYIANWPESRRDDWNRLLRERAIENKVDVIAVNCAGTDPAGIAYVGDSCLLSPEGEIRGECEAWKDDIKVLNL